jgi:hypothetical protein
VDTQWPDISRYHANADIAGIRRETDAIEAQVSYGTHLDPTMPARRDGIRGRGFMLAIFWVPRIRPLRVHVERLVGEHNLPKCVFVLRRSASARPTEIPQVRAASGVPHRFPTDKTAFPGTRRHTC